MQHSDEIQRLLSELDDHDDDEGFAGNVWSDVITAMERAWEQLHDYSAGARGAEALMRAADEVQRVIALLVAVHERLERLAAAEPAGARNGRQAPRPVTVRWVTRSGSVSAASLRGDR
jgi:hypothetical protein